jgi:hypothetical protein
VRASILLLGGGSSVGKSTVARRLANEDGYAHVNLRELDGAWGDPRLELVRERGDWALPTEHLCARLVERARLLEPHVVRWVETRAPEDARCVLEGEGIEPSIAAQLPPDLPVRVVFLIERNPDRLRSTLERRSSSFRGLSAAEQTAIVALNERYNRRLLDRATACDQAWLASQPWDTLVSRLRALLTVP